MPPTHAASFGGIQREGDAKVRREGFGSELGNLGKGIEGGKLLVRDSWNGQSLSFLLFLKDIIDFIEGRFNL